MSCSHSSRGSREIQCHDAAFDAGSWLSRRGQFVGEIGHFPLASRRDDKRFLMRFPLPFSFPSRMGMPTKLLMRLSEHLSECTQGSKPLFEDFSGFMIEGHGFGCPRKTAQRQSRSCFWEPSDMAQCSTCGSTVPESVAVCPDCGMELKSASAPAVVTSPAAGGLFDLFPDFRGEKLTHRTRERLRTLGSPLCLFGRCPRGGSRSLCSHGTVLVSMGILGTTAP